MEILRAEEMGFCFGVRDALEIARAVQRPQEVTIHGELVHNEAVLDELRERGFRMSAEAARATPPTPRVLVTAHGISDRERGRLRAEGKDLVDTTCPLVRRAHAAALELQAEGRFVVVVGKPGHVEVQGLIGDLDRAVVVADAKSVESWPEPRIGVLCQTTCPSELAGEVLAEIRRRNPEADLRFVDSVCHPTKNRRRALEELLPRVDAVIVVGGRSSNNSRRLVELCLERGVRAELVSSPEELDERMVEGVEVLGLTAGTSTPDEIIDAVERRLLEFALC